METQRLRTVPLRTVPGELHGAVGTRGELAVLLTKTGHKANRDTLQLLAHFLAWISYEGEHLCVNKQGVGIPERL